MFQSSLTVPPNQDPERLTGEADAERVVFRTISRQCDLAWLDGEPLSFVDEESDGNQAEGENP